MALCEVTLKTGVNTRMPLSERLARKRADSDTDGVVGSLHNPLESTYDVDYTASVVQGTGGFTQRTLGSATGSRFFAKPILGDDAALYGSGNQYLETHSGKRQSGPFNRAASTVQTDNVPDKSSGANADDDGNQDEAKAADAKVDLPYVVISHPTSEWESVAHAATRSVQPVQRLDFYASVRKEEQRDDDARGAMTGGTQRAVDIRTKRATAPQMRPLEPVYQSAEPVEMPISVMQEKGLIRRNYLDLVECEFKNPNTEQELGYDQQPEGRLPGSDLSWGLPVQSKAITHMGTTEDMFWGTAKTLEDRPVSYAGHIPAAERNRAAIPHGEDIRRQYAKSFMTLAVHGGGVDASITSKSMRARHRTGKNAPVPRVPQPRDAETLSRMMEGSMLQAAVIHTTEREKRMNIRDDKKATQYF